MMYVEAPARSWIVDLNKRTSVLMPPSSSRFAFACDSSGSSTVYIVNLLHFINYSKCHSMLFLALLAFLGSCRRSRARPEVSYFNKKEFAQQLLAKLNTQKNTRRHSDRVRSSGQNGFEPVASELTPKKLMIFDAMLRQPWMFGMSKRQARLLLRLAAQTNMRKMTKNVE